MTEQFVPSDALLTGYRALRQDVGAVALPRDVIRIFGPQAIEYLQGQSSQDVAALGVGDTAESLVLAPDGKLVALVRLTRTAGDEVVLDCDAGWGSVVTARLARFKLRTKVEIEDLAWSCVAVRGPHAGRSGGEGSLVLAVSASGSEGYDLLGPAPHPPDGVPWCDPQAWDAVRIEAGIPVMGADLDEHTIAAEAHLVERTVSFTKGCYTGQELVARLDARGNRVARRLCGLVLDDQSVDPSTLAGAVLGRPAADTSEANGPEGDKPAADKGVGRITSAAWCPGVGGPAALGYVHRSVEMGGRVLVGVSPGSGDSPVGRASSDRSAVVAEVRQLPLV